MRQSRLLECGGTTPLWPFGRGHLTENRKTRGVDGFVLLFLM